MRSLNVRADVEVLVGHMDFTMSVVDLAKQIARLTQFWISGAVEPLVDDDKLVRTSSGTRPIRLGESSK
jgi:hypothetical protein